MSHREQQHFNTKQYAYIKHFSAKFIFRVADYLYSETCLYIKYIIYVYHYTPENITMYNINNIGNRCANVNMCMCRFEIGRRENRIALLLTLSAACEQTFSYLYNSRVVYYPVNIAYIRMRSNRQRRKPSPK